MCIFLRSLTFSFWVLSLTFINSIISIVIIITKCKITIIVENTHKTQTPPSESHNQKSVMCVFVCVCILRLCDRRLRSTSRRFSLTHTLVNRKFGGSDCCCCHHQDLLPRPADPGPTHTFTFWSSFFVLPILSLSNNHFWFTNFHFWPFANKNPFSLHWN